MKKLLLSAALFSLFSGMAYASNDGFYVGAQAGYGDQGYDTHHAFIPFGQFGTRATDVSYTAGSSSLGISHYNNVDSSGFAWGFTAGYQYNKNLAAEMGFTQLADTSSKAGDNLGNLPLAFGKATIEEKAVSLTGKLMYPTQWGLNFYTKLGAAWVHADQDYDVTAYTYSLNNQGNVVQTASTTKYSTSTNPIRPVFGAGVSYDLDQNLSTDLSWTRIEGNGLIQNIDVYSLGLVYHFS